MHEPFAFIRRDDPEVDDLMGSDEDGVAEERLVELGAVASEDTEEQPRSAGAES